LHAAGLLASVSAMMLDPHRNKQLHQAHSAQLPREHHHDQKNHPKRNMSKDSTFFGVEHVLQKLEHDSKQHDRVLEVVLDIKHEVQQLRLVQQQLRGTLLNEGLPAYEVPKYEVPPTYEVPKTQEQAPLTPGATLAKAVTQIVKKAKPISLEHLPGYTPEIHAERPRSNDSGDEGPQAQTETHANEHHGHGEQHPNRHTRISQTKGMKNLINRQDQLHDSPMRRVVNNIVCYIPSEYFREMFMFLADTYESIQEPERTGVLYTITESRFFGHMTLLVIVCNAVVAAYLTNWELENIGERPPPNFTIAETSFLIYYTMELVLRCLVHRLHFFINKDKTWNNFDMALVVISWQDFVFTYFPPPNVDSNNTANVVFLRAIRLMRVAKMLRVVRVVRMVRELQNMIDSFRRSLLALFWSIIILMMTLYIFALLFVQGITNHLSTEGTNIDPEFTTAVQTHFGGVVPATISMYMAVTGGEDWSIYYDIVKSCGVLYSGMFLLFTFFFMFSLFNIMTGIVVEKALLAATPDRDEIILQQKKKVKRETNEFRELCRQLDADDSGTISFTEFMKSMRDDRMVSYMASTGLEVHDVEVFFKSVAGAGDDEEVDVDKFVYGCMALKGPASGLDVRGALHESTRINYKVVEMDQALNARMDQVMVILQHQIALSREVQRRMAAPKEVDHVLNTRYDQNHAQNAGPEGNVDSTPFKELMESPFFSPNGSQEENVTQFKRGREAVPADAEQERGEVPTNAQVTGSSRDAEQNARLQMLLGGLKQRQRQIQHRVLVK
jgi:hypothetical protein